jgi:phosphatidylglycerophosphate synthase
LLVYRTPLTPNHITYLATLVGCMAGVCWLFGTPAMMLLGGALLWTSAILDGADGILARAKQIQSDVGRSLDGAADFAVAMFTVGAGFWHVWITRQQPWDLLLMAIALGTSIAQVYLYDFYRESYLSFTNPDWNGKFESVSDVETRYHQLKEQKAFWLYSYVTNLYVTVLGNETRMVKLTNPNGLREHLRFTVNQQTIDIYRRHNKWPMKLWPLVSTAPHAYLMSLCGMFDRLELYLWFRVVIANAIFIVVLIWQRIATNRTRRDFEQIGAAPVPKEEAKTRI